MDFSSTFAMAVPVYELHQTSLQRSTALSCTNKIFPEQPLFAPRIWAGDINSELMPLSIQGTYAALLPTTSHSGRPYPNESEPYRPAKRTKTNHRQQSFPEGSSATLQHLVQQGDSPAQVAYNHNSNPIPSFITRSRGDIWLPASQITPPPSPPGTIKVPGISGFTTLQPPPHGGSRNLSPQHTAAGAQRARPHHNRKPKQYSDTSLLHGARKALFEDRLGTWCLSPSFSNSLPTTNLDSYIQIWHLYSVTSQQQQLLIGEWPPGLGVVPPQFGWPDSFSTSELPLWGFCKWNTRRAVCSDKIGSDAGLIMEDLGNYAPRRTLFLESNMWLKDFAPMVKSPHIRAAILALAGLYLYDYTPSPWLNSEVNAKFKIVQKRIECLFGKLPLAQRLYLQNCDAVQEGNDSEMMKEAEVLEFVTLLILASMMDMVSPNPANRARHWLAGFAQAERIIAGRERSEHRRRSPQQESQEVFVNRIVILNGLLSPLPKYTKDKHEKTLYAYRYNERFAYLKFGNDKDKLAIHGGCGFSKQLLHTFHDIKWCSTAVARQIETETGDPYAIRYYIQDIHEDLEKMRQYSTQSIRYGSFEEAMKDTAVFELLRDCPENVTMENSKLGMQKATAEAWRILAIIYTLCRAKRLPRDHPEVLESMERLAICIRTIPTAGFAFTAQAPLLPIFFLGLLAVEETHYKISQRWFDEVTSHPVRSTVPPLYKILKDGRQWINEVSPLLCQGRCPPEYQGGDLTNCETENFVKRIAWWEKLVDRIPETICLT